jgi:hypothetical protein
MSDGEIDDKTRHATLWNHLVAAFIQHRTYGSFKVIRGLISSFHRALHDTGSSKGQILFQNPYAAGTAIARGDFVRL